MFRGGGGGMEVSIAAAESRERRGRRRRMGKSCGLNFGTGEGKLGKAERGRRWLPILSVRLDQAVQLEIRNLLIFRLSIIRYRKIKIG